MWHSENIPPCSVTASEHFRFCCVLPSVIFTISGRINKMNNFLLIVIWMSKEVVMQNQEVDL